MTSAPSIQLTAPNGQSWEQPTGLFINNEFVASSGNTITSIDPACVFPPKLCEYPAT